MEDAHTALILLVVILQAINCSTAADNQSKIEFEIHEHDGTLGLVPDTFNEVDTPGVRFIGRKVKEFLAACTDASLGDIDECENCPEVFTNSRRLSTFDGKCDALSNYYFRQLRFIQRQSQQKIDLAKSMKIRIIFIFLYLACIILGCYLLIMKQFRLRTLWDKFAEDPTQGMRSFRYERMKFKFDYDDPGGDPEDLTGYENWELYNSSEDDEPINSFTGGVGPEQALARKKRENRRVQETGPSEWPWERPDYDFSLIPYKEGLKKDMEDWEAHEGSNFNSNI